MNFGGGHVGPLLQRLCVAPVTRGTELKARSLPTKITVYLVLIVLSGLFLMPLAWTISTSLKPNQQTMTLPPKWWPDKPLWRNYRDAVMYRSEELGYIPMLRQARNTVYLAALSVTGTVISNSLIAYAFARLRWRGRDVLFALTLATMMVPFPVTMVAVFSVFKELGWIGSFRPLWVPAWFGSAFNIFLLRQFFLTIPRDLSDAAAIDGCTELQIFRHIILPQTIRIVLPPIGNEFIALLKDSSLVSILAVSDLLRRGREYASKTFSYFETFTVVALVYLVFTLFFSRLVGMMEERLHRRGRTG